MSNKNYSNYNRSYSSNQYSNDKSYEKRFGDTSSSKKYFDERTSSAEYSNEEKLKNDKESKFKNSGNNYYKPKGVKTSFELPSGLFIFLVLFILIFGTAFVFLPQISEAIRSQESKDVINIITSQFEGDDQQKPAPKSKSELEAEKYGLKEDDYLLLKKLNRTSILNRLDDASFKPEEKDYLAFRAIEDDDSEVLERLFASGCCMDLQDNEGASLLYTAILKDKSKCVDLLVNSGANIKLETNDGETILHAAAKTGNMKIAKMAIMSGIPVDKSGKSGKTPLYRAAEGNQREMSRLLVWAGAARYPHYANITKDSKLRDFYLTGRASWTYLDLSDISNSKSKFSGNQGIDKEAEEEERWSKVHNLISNGRLSDLLREVPNAADFSKMSKYDLPPACVAARSRQLEVIKYLAGVGCDMNEADPKTGKSALHYASENGYENIVEFLVKIPGVDVNLKDNLNNTALHYSIVAPLPFATIKLLEAGANPNAVNLRLQTPLHVAAEKCNVLGTRLLLANGVDVNVQDYAGNTALHYVALKSDMKNMLDAYYEYEDKLNFTITNNKGKTPRDIQRWDYFKYYEEHYR